MSGVMISFDSCLLSCHEKALYDAVEEATRKLGAELSGKLKQSAERLHNTKQAYVALEDEYRKLAQGRS